MPAKNRAHYRGSYAKRADCAGNAVTRLVDAEKRLHTLDYIPLGLYPPSEYVARKRYHVPADAAVGPGSVSQVVTFLCESGTTIARRSVPISILPRG